MPFASFEASNQKQKQPMQKIENETVLFDLPDSVLDRCDGPIWEAMQAAGYDKSPRNFLNDWNAWSMTVGEFLEQVRASETV
jgi:hypothetical protein